MRFAALMAILALILAGCALPWTRATPPVADVVEPDLSAKNAPEEPASPEEDRNSLVGPPAPAPDYADAWHQLAHDFTWQTSINESIRAELNSFARRPKGFARASRYAEPFLWHIADTLSQRGLPAELALLPMLESHYRAIARGPNGAAGLWQFMPATGKHLGLQESHWYSARSDVVASTDAALNYLETLHKEFNNDWLLAVAAYNCGAGNVQRALDDSGGTDYWSIRNKLPHETQHFVPRLLAAVAIVASPADYGINLYPIANSAYFAEVDLGGPADLRYFERSEEFSTPVFKRLNAAYKLPYTGPDGPFRILVPVDLEEHATELLRDLPADRGVPQTVHVIRGGDTLSGIADRYGVPLDSIRRDNQLTSNLLTIGRELVISGAVPAADALLAVSGSAVPLRHTVQPGDSFWTIGRRYATTGKTIAVLNNMSLGDTLHVGQQLTIRRTQELIEYLVATGDSLWTIARKFNVTIQQLCDWNGLPRQQSLQPGRTLIIANPTGNSGRPI